MTSKSVRLNLWAGNNLRNESSSRSKLSSSNGVAAAILLGALGALAAAPVAESTGNSTLFVVAKAPAGQTVQDLLKSRFFEKVTCSRSCTMTTSAAIRARTARQLGFKRVGAGQWFEIGSATAVLKANKVTKVTIRLNAQAKKRLPKARNAVQLIGRTNATSNRPPRVKGSANWIVNCSRR